MELTCIKSTRYPLAILLPAILLFFYALPEEAKEPSLVANACHNISAEFAFDLESKIEEASRKYDLAPELILSVIVAESSCRPKVISHAGAIGLMQLMPKTADWLGVEDPFSVEQNIDGGSKYLARMLKTFDGELELALAAYNAGPTRVRRLKRVPNIRETKNYIKRVLKQYESLLREA